MGESQAQRAMIASRASLMYAWKGEESYALHQILLQELWDKELKRMLQGTADDFSVRKGYLQAVTEIMGLAERSINEHKRQVEAA